MWFIFHASCFSLPQVPADSNVNTSINKNDEKVGDGKYSSHSLDEVAGMIRSTLSAYESKVNMLSFVASSWTYNCDLLAGPFCWIRYKIA